MGDTNQVTKERDEQENESDFWRITITTSFWPLCQEEKPEECLQESPRRRTCGGPGIACCAWPKEPKGLTTLTQ